MACNGQVEAISHASDSAAYRLNRIQRGRRSSFHAAPRPGIAAGDFLLALAVDARLAPCQNRLRHNGADLLLAFFECLRDIDVCKSAARLGSQSEGDAL